ncbi:MAG: tail fiber domain-containing protein [Bacteroidia bacterium]|nr:tail fiber domain-containing protein [Bacteroidia bacterium]
MKKQLTSLLITTLSLTGLQEVSAQSPWLLNGNAGTTSTNFIGTTDAKALKIKTNNQTRMTITSSGKIGIANAAPVSRLDILGITSSTEPVLKSVVKYTGGADVIAIEGSSTPSDTSGIGVRGTGNYIGVQGWSNLIGVDGFGITGVFGSSAVADEVSYPTGVWGESDSGDVGNGVFGYAGRSNQNIAVWGIATDTATVGGIRDYAGFFQGNVFGYRFFQLSDERMKKDIRPLGTTLAQLMNVKTATYHYKSGEHRDLHLPAGIQVGFLAENLQQQFPNLVSETTLPSKVHPKNGLVIAEEADVKVVNYLGMIPVLTRAIQEQQEQMEWKDEKISRLQQQLELLESRLSKLESAASGVSTEKITVPVSSVVLGQNIPNPANEMTLISYALPETAQQAKLTVSDAEGKVLREIKLSQGKGQIQLDLQGLSQGQYFYSMYSNGSLLETKSFQVIR